MSKLNIIRKCYGCGAILQDEDPNKEGYIEKEVLENQSRVTLCNKCFSKESYDFEPNKVIISKSLKVMLDDAKATDALIVYILDLFSFEASFSPLINDYLSGRNVLVVASKRDLISSKVDDEVLKVDVAHRLRREKIKIKDVVLVSSTVEKNISQLINAINKYRNGHDVYLIGCEGCGKTYLLNVILKNFKNSTKRAIKTMEYPGTTSSVLQIPLDKNSTLFDTVGIKIENSIIEHVESELKKIIIPISEVKEHSFKIDDDSIFVGGLAKIDFVKSKPTTVYLYFSDKIELKKVNNKKANQQFLKLLSKKKIRPCSKKINNMLDFNTYEIKITENEERDIGIQGLGWISFKGDGQTIIINVPKGVAIYSCRAKIPHVNKQR